MNGSVTKNKLVLAIATSIAGALSLLGAGMDRSACSDTFQRDTPDTSQQVSGHAERAAQQQNLLDTIAQESLSESLERLGSEGFSSAFAGDPNDRNLFDQMDTRTNIIHQPRVARILLAAVHGSKGDRRKILNETMERLTQHVENLKGQLAGRVAEEASRPINHDLAMVIPLILAEVDDAGRSLPLLLEWYDLASTGAQRSIEVLREIGVATPERNEVSWPTLDGSATAYAEKPRWEVMDLIAPAVLEIMADLKVDKARAKILRDPSLGEETKPHSWHRFELLPGAKGPVLELDGYQMFPGLSAEESDALMERLRKYLILVSG